MSTPSSSQPKRIGRRVFPNPNSDQIRRSTQLLHYEPPPEPPIDYTIRVPQDKGYRVVTNVFERPPSTDYSKEESHLVSAVNRDRKNTVEEVLDELDTVLFEASIPFNELKKKVETFNISFKPYAPDVNIDEIPEQSYSRVPKVIPKLVNRESRSRQIYEDGDSKNNGKARDLDEKSRKLIEDKYKMTLQSISNARIYYTPEVFRKQYEQEGIPAWKRNLLAEKKSKETIKQIEHNSWLEYEQFKKSLKPVEKIRRSRSIQIAQPRKRLE